MLKARLKIGLPTFKIKSSVFCRVIHGQLTIIIMISKLTCCAAFILCVSIFCYGCMFAFVVLDSVFQY